MDITENWYRPTEIAKYNKNKHLRKREYKDAKNWQCIDKQWILKNNPFNKKLSEEEIKFINSFRNSNSHDSTQIVKDKVYEIIDGEIIDRTNIVVSLSQKLVSIYTLSIHFHAILLLEANMWIAGYIILKKYDLFKYNKAKVDFSTYISNFPSGRPKEFYLKSKPALSSLINFISGIHKKLMDISVEKLKITRKDLGKKEITNKATDNVMSIYQLLSEYSLTGFWNRLHYELDYYNTILGKFGYCISDLELEKAQLSAQAETLNMTQISLYHMITSIEGYKNIDLFSEFVATKGESGITEEILSKMFELVGQKDKRYIDAVFAFTLIQLGFAIIAGVGMFQQNIDLIVKKIPKALE